MFCLWNVAGKGNCVIDKARRNWCPYCRLQRCFASRMNVAGKRVFYEDRCQRGSVFERNFLLTLLPYLKWPTFSTSCCKIFGRPFFYLFNKCNLFLDYELHTRRLVAHCPNPLQKTRIPKQLMIFGESHSIIL